MEAEQRINILKDLISKGGLMAGCAKLYLNDEVMGSRFIIECSEQCHNELAFEYWGSELVLDIIKYSKQFKAKSICNYTLTN